jgi:hypothetical protein
VFKKKIVIFIIITISQVGFFSLALSNENHIYSTGMSMEPDKCASAWLIKRKIDKDAVFIFFPDGELITKGIPFDSPESTLSRTHNLSTFEVIKNKYKISDQYLDKIAIYIHDIEVNFWGKKQSPDSNIIKMELNKIIDSSSNNEECLIKCFDYFDTLIEELK